MRSNTEPRFHRYWIKGLTLGCTRNYKVGCLWKSIARCISRDAVDKFSLPLIHPSRMQRCFLTLFFLTLLNEFKRLGILVYYSPFFLVPPFKIESLCVSFFLKKKKRTKQNNEKKKKRREKWKRKGGRKGVNGYSLSREIHFQGLGSFAGTRYRPSDGANWWNATVEQRGSLISRKSFARPVTREL